MKIDIIKTTQNYNNNLFEFDLLKPFNLWSVKSNVYYFNNKTNLINSIGDKNHYMGLFSPTKRFINYKLLWRTDVIEIFYDNRKVREITDPYILSQFNKRKIRVIINNSITNKSNKKNPTVSDFHIKYFRS